METTNRFRFRVQLDGREKRGVLRAPSLEEAQKALLEQGFSVLELVQAEPAELRVGRMPITRVRLRAVFLGLLGIGLLSGTVRCAANLSTPKPIMAKSDYVLEVSGKLPPSGDTVAFIFPDVPLTLNQSRAKLPVDGNGEFHARFELSLPRRPLRVVVRVGEQVSREAFLVEDQTFSAKVDFDAL